MNSFLPGYNIKMDITIKHGHDLVHIFTIIFYKGIIGK